MPKKLKLQARYTGLGGLNAIHDHLCMLTRVDIVKCFLITVLSTSKVELGRLVKTGNLVVNEPNFIIRLDHAKSHWLLKKMNN